MIQFYLVIKNHDSEFTKHIKFYFRNFNYKVILSSDLINITGNLLFINTELYPKKGFEENFKTILTNKEFCYLSKCKNIYYIPKKSYKYEDTTDISNGTPSSTLKIDFTEKYNVLFTNAKYCPIKNEKYKIVPEDSLPFYYLMNKKQIGFIYNENIAIKYVNDFIKLELSDKIFYNFIILINNDNLFNVIEQLEKLTYLFCRITIFIQNIKYENEDYLKTKLKKLSKILFIKSFNVKKNNMILKLLENNILCFEHLVFLKNNSFNINTFINTTTDILKHYKVYISNEMLAINSVIYGQMPFYYTNRTEFDELINIPRIISLNLSQCKNSIYIEDKSGFSLKNLELVGIPFKYSLVENKLLMMKEYNILFQVIENHLKTIKLPHEYFHTTIKKITIAVLLDKENVLNDQMLNIVNVITDKNELFELYIFINNTRFEAIKQNLCITLLSKFEDNEQLFFMFLVNCLKIKNTKDNLLKLFDTIIKNEELVKKKITDKNSFVLNLLNQISLNNIFTNDDIIAKLNIIISKFIDITDVRSFDSLLKYANTLTQNKSVLINFIILLATIFDPYYKTYNEFIEVRKVILQNLTMLKDKLEIKLSLDEIIMFTVGNFHLSYQGVSSVDIFKLKTEINRNICPELNFKIDMNFKNEKIKVLFHAEHLTRQHSVFKDRHQVIKALASDDRFDVYFSTFDELTQEVRFLFGSAKHIILPKQLSKIKTRLAKEKLDILVYCEIGMHPISYYMAHMKLAKIQCNTWGHSDTSGIDTIDYYFSSKLYELPYEESQKHYSEKLILQNSLCTSYVNPLNRHNPKLFQDRLRFGVTNDTIIYFCAQSLFKLNPLFDEYIVGILKRVPNAILFLLEHSDKYKVLERFNNKGIGHQIKFSPMLQHFGYMNLMNISDVVLDVYPFGGCNSSFEAFSLGKVIVTQPSDMINGRFTSGFYKKMELDEFISKTKKAYIDFAVKLGTNKHYRETMEKKIIAKRACLYLDKETLQEWKDDLIKIYSASKKIDE